MRVKFSSDLLKVFVKARFIFRGSPRPALARPSFTSVLASTLTAENISPADAALDRNLNILLLQSFLNLFLFR